MISKNKIYKIVCLGDSLTAEYEISKENSWVHLLGENLDISCINKGIPGDTTGGMLSRLKYDVIDLKPSHVILLGGTNDLYHRIAFNHIISNLTAIARQLKFHNIQTIIGFPPPIFANSAEDQNEVFESEMVLSRKIIEFKSLLKQFVKEDDQPFIDFSEGMTREHLMPDGVHSNKRGHQLMFENALQIFE